MNIRLSVSRPLIGRRGPYEHINYPVGTLPVLRSSHFLAEQVLLGLRSGSDSRAV